MGKESETSSGRSPGRPRGMTAQGEDTRERLYEVAIEQITEKGYEHTTMRGIAREAGVSAAALYRYFDSKQAILWALYEHLSSEYVETITLEPGKWRDRFMIALRHSLSVLTPHREAIVALVPTLVDREMGVLSAATSVARDRVSGVFLQSVVQADDAPPEPVASALGRVLYMAHLGVVLWWSLDQSGGQHTTDKITHLISNLLPLFSISLITPPVRKIVLQIDDLVGEAFWAQEASCGLTDPSRRDPTRRDPTV